jgi:uncharacterized protein (TIGR03382 family)
VTPPTTPPVAQPTPPDSGVDAVTAGVDTGSTGLGSGPDAAEIGGGIAGLLLAALGGLVLARRRRAGSDA